MSFDIAAKVFSALRVARKKEFRNKVAIPGRMAAEVLGTYERNPFETSEDLRRFFEVSMVVEYALDELLQAAQELPVWPEGIEDLIDLINEGHQQFMEDTKRLARVHPLYKQGLQDGLELPGIALPPPDDSQAKDSPVRLPISLPVNRGSPPLFVLFVLFVGKYQEPRSSRISTSVTTACLLLWARRKSFYGGKS